MASSAQCPKDEVPLDVSVFLFFVLYNTICGVLLVYFSVKILRSLWRRRKKRTTRTFKVKPRRTTVTKAPEEKDVGTSQGLAIKRLLFHKMNQSQASEYVEKTVSQVSQRGGKPWETDLKKIKFKKKIGAGNFGEVWVATWMQSTVAVKTVLKSMTKNREFMDKFMEEIELMSELNHPNIVMFLGAVIEPPSLCLILEYCVNGNLIDFLQSARGRDISVSMHLILKMALDIARGIKYLHEKVKIIQRDIKGRNVLVDENLNCKIADFGLSRIKNDEDATLTACGTPAWTAPEVVRMEDYNEKVDVYSFGVVLWELFMREEPYAGEGGIQIAYAAAEQGLRPEVPAYAPERYARLMEECWADSPDDRPNFSEILERLFQMMKDESNPFKAAEFYFGLRKNHFEDDIKQILDEFDLTRELFAEDYMGIVEDRRRVQQANPQPASDPVKSFKDKHKQQRTVKLFSGDGPSTKEGLAALLPQDEIDSSTSLTVQKLETEVKEEEECETTVVNEDELKEIEKSED